MVHRDADHGEVHINTGTGTSTGGGPNITDGARAQQPRSGGRAITTLVSWFVISTGSNTVGTTGHGASSAINTNSAGAVNTTGTLSQPWRTAGGAFADQMPIPSVSRFVFIKTGTDAINGHRRAQIAGGAGSAIATAGGAFRDQMLIPSQFVFESAGTGAARASAIVIKEKTGSTITIGPGAQIASAGAVIAHGAAAVNTNNDAAVNIYKNQTSNIFWSGAVVGPMISFGLGIMLCSSKKLDAGVVVAVGFLVKRKVRRWAARLLKKIKDD